MTLLGQSQKQIQVSMGGGRDQHFVSSVFCAEAKGKCGGSNLLLHLPLRDAEGGEEAGGLPRGAGMVAWHGEGMFPSLVLPSSFFSGTLGSPAPGRLSMDLHGCWDKITFSH